MTSECREVVLGAAAQWYFESWMREYDLPSLALSSVDWERGTFSTWLPTDVPEEAAQCFEVGFWRESRMDLQGAGTCLWIFEEPYSSPSDPFWVNNPADHIVPSATRVYYVLTGTMPPALIAKAVSNAMSTPPPMVGVRSSIRAEKIRRPLEAQTLSAVAREVQSLVIGASGGEGFVTWRPR
jgi:hypothetical protein